MRSHAEQDTEKEAQRLKAALAEETKKILASAEQEIAAATLQARQLLQQQAAGLAIEQAARKLVVTAETDRLLVQHFAQRPDLGQRRELMAAALSLRYAHAFADVAESGHLDPRAAESQLRDFAETVAGSHDLREVFDAPSIEQGSKLKVLDAIAARASASTAQVRNFLAVIIEHGRLTELPEIITEFRDIADKDSGAVEAKITTARPLADADRKLLEAEVTRMAGASVRATYVQDPALLGGAVVEIGSTIYDGSVRAQLEQLKQRMVNA